MVQVKVYSKPSCVQCNATKRALGKAEVPFTEVDVSQDLEAFDHVTGALGYQQVPVVEVFDASGAVTDHWSGFQPDNIRALV